MDLDSYMQAYLKEGYYDQLQTSKKIDPIVYFFSIFLDRVWKKGSQKPHIKKEEYDTFLSLIEEGSYLNRFVKNHALDTTHSWTKQEECDVSYDLLCFLYIYLKYFEEETKDMFKSNEETEERLAFEVVDIMIDMIAGIYENDNSKWKGKIQNKLNELSFYDWIRERVTEKREETITFEFTTSFDKKRKERRSSSSSFLGFRKR